MFSGALPFIAEHYTSTRKNANIATIVYLEKEKK